MQFTGVFFSKRFNVNDFVHRWNYGVCAWAHYNAKKKNYPKHF